MSIEFAQEYEYKSKSGTTVSRLGPVMRKTGTKGVLTNLEKTTLKRLSEILRIEGLGDHDIDRYLSLMSNLEELRHMNMMVLANVIMFYKNLGKKSITTKNLNMETLDTYLESMLPKHIINEEGRKIAEEDMAIIKLRLAATMFRYIILTQDLLGGNTSKSLRSYESDESESSD